MSAKEKELKIINFLKNYPEIKTCTISISPVRIELRNINNFNIDIQMLSNSNQHFEDYSLLIEADIKQSFLSTMSIFLFNLHLKYYDEYWDNYMNRNPDDKSINYLNSKYKVKQ